MVLLSQRVRYPKAVLEKIRNSFASKVRTLTLTHTHIPQNSNISFQLLSLWRKKKVTTIFHDIITSTILQLFKCFFQCAKSSTCIILMRSLQQPGKLNSVIPHIADGKDLKMSRVACLMSTPEGHMKLSQTGSELWII